MEMIISSQRSGDEWLMAYGEWLAFLSTFGGPESSSLVDAATLIAGASVLSSTQFAGVSHPVAVC
jgi:hypothetical protein